MPVGRSKLLPQKFILKKRKKQENKLFIRTNKYTNTHTHTHSHKKTSSTANGREGEKRTLPELRRN